ncbi:hypothetical protein KIN20_022173 [Parelaphostrongylus tenuis]|uniref:Uncharacterized protein n=1 Tax=Parelaphostrongylus tenuis TaxID=148309 RepID=A0AAD5N5Z2_PARTN|nr:hypothetical protein KIN20_022173 [Parelaphostrongylus tenuis]
MDEDEFPFEDHDLGSLNGAPMLDVDENGYVVFPSEDSVDGYYDVLDIAEDEDENCYDGIYSDESFDSDCHVTECPALMQFEDEKLYDDHNSEDLIDSDSPVLNLPARNAVLEDIENNPGMSVSAGQDDNERLRDVSLNDLWDMFLYAAEIGRVDKLRNMLAQCPDLVSRSNEGGYTALHRAARNNHLEGRLVPTGKWR